MALRNGIFSGDDPFVISRGWLAEAEQSEINDPNAMALSTVDASGMPNVRVVLLKNITDDAFVFYTNYESAKGTEIQQSGMAAFVLHWKSIRRQVRVRGHVVKEDGKIADDYYRSRALDSRLGAWASKQSRPLESREALLQQVESERQKHGGNPPRPSFWGGFRITPLEVEFWAEGDFRLHDRFVWRRGAITEGWQIQRLNP
ncbi:MAG: pyridoxamine 5'-phosphate oxidase [Pseudomonadota bacterium]